MALIFIEQKGVRHMVEESTLTKTEGRHEDDNEIATWQEWYLDGELVKRDAQVQLKKWPEGFAEAGVLG